MRDLAELLFKTIPLLAQAVPAHDRLETLVVEHARLDEL